MVPTGNKEPGGPESIILGPSKTPPVAPRQASSLRKTAMAVFYVYAIHISRPAQGINMHSNYHYKLCQLYRPRKPTIIVGAAPSPTIRINACRRTPPLILLVSPKTSNLKGANIAQEKESQLSMFLGYGDPGIPTKRAVIWAGRGYSRCGQSNGKIGRDRRACTECP